MEISQKDPKDIIYKFESGTYVEIEFFIIDMTGRRRKFLIHINDEKGITSCINMKLCKCGKPTRYKKSKLCNACYVKNWRLKHPEETKESGRKSTRKWIANNRDKHNSRRRNKNKIPSKTCNILKQHSMDLKDDPNRLSTDFILKMIAGE